MHARLRLFLALGCLAAASVAPAAAQVEFLTVDHVCDLEHDPTPNPRYVPPPAWFEPDALRRTANITVNYNPASCGTTTAQWTPDARAAFQMAVDIWAAILNGDDTIEIDACWVNNLAATTLGSTSARWSRNFTNAPQADTWYPVALANQFANSDVNGNTSEIFIRFNSNFDWFLGTGAQDNEDQPNFVTVVLHEIAHGLGFSGFMRVDDGINNGTTNLNECNGTAGVGCWGTSGADPGIYDRFTENGAGTAILGFANNSTALGDELTSDDVFFDGPTANILNGFTPPELFAPATWNPGSSYSHLAEGFNNTDHALMTWSLSDGEVIHHPGEVTLGILQDLGWDLRNLSNVWVDAANTSGVEVGSPGSPFDTVFEGVSAVYPGGTVWIEGGNYPESISVIKPYVLRSTGSTVVIGQ